MKLSLLQPQARENRWNDYRNVPAARVHWAALSGTLNRSELKPATRVDLAHSRKRRLPTGGPVAATCHPIDGN
jgi:hypothetical protein